VKTVIKGQVNNFQLTRFFMEKIKKRELEQNKILHANGVPMHYFKVFQLILIMKDDELSTKNISELYAKIFGTHIMQSSLSRTLKYLASELQLIEYVNNPFNSKYTWVRLTQEGKKAQKIFVEGHDYPTLPFKVVERLISNGN